MRERKGVTLRAQRLNTVVEKWSRLRPGLDTRWGPSQTLPLRSVDTVRTARQRLPLRAIDRNTKNPVKQLRRRMSARDVRKSARTFKGLSTVNDLTVRKNKNQVLIIFEKEWSKYSKHTFQQR